MTNEERIAKLTESVANLTSFNEQLIQRFLELEVALNERFESIYTAINRLEENASPQDDNCGFVEGDL